jgi:hypothetical protein
LAFLDNNYSCDLVLISPERFPVLEASTTTTVKELSHSTEKNLGSKISSTAGGQLIKDERLVSALV